MCDSKTMIFELTLGNLFLKIQHVDNKGNPVKGLILLGLIPKRDIIH